MKHFGSCPIHPVISLPETYPVYDLNQNEDILCADKNAFGIGRYNEKRERIYVSPLFHGVRNIHMGIDFFAPVKTPIHAFAPGKIYLFGNNSSPGDYGFTLITEHRFGEDIIYALFGHLSEDSLEGKREGQSIYGGERIAFVGDRHENGNWTPHLHFQLSREKPEVADLPGVVSEADHEEALKRFPDPRIILGPVYL